jgi:hypothetical protein
MMIAFIIHTLFVEVSAKSLFIITVSLMITATTHMFSEVLFFIAASYKLTFTSIIKIYMNKFK